MMWAVWIVCLGSLSGKRQCDPLRPVPFTSFEFIGEART